MHGKGGTFCAGYDLEFLASQKNKADFDSSTSGDGGTGTTGLDYKFFNPLSTEGIGPMVTVNILVLIDL